MKISEQDGPYDLATESMRRQFRAEAVVAIVISGEHGTGVSIRGPEDIKFALPGLFRGVTQAVEDAIAAQRRDMVCPACGTDLAFDPRHGLKHDEVEAGTLTVCAACAHFLVKEDEGWRLVTPQDLAEMSAGMRAALTRRRRLIERRRGAH